MRAEGFALILLLWVGAPVLAGVPEDVNHLWTFDEGQGFLAADSLGDRPGVVYGATWVAGRIGAALRLDGVDDYVELPDNDPVWLPVNDFTICFWVYCEREIGEFDYDAEVLVDLNFGASSRPENELGYNVQRRSDTGRISFQMSTTSNTDEDMYSQTVIQRGRWYHVTAVRKGSIQTVYINGRMDTSRVCSMEPIRFTGGYDDDKVNVGRYTTARYGPQGHFRGVLDELMILDEALSAQRVRKLYHEGGGGSDLYVDGTRGSDLYDGRQPATALATIQRAVDMAVPGDIIGVYPGIYRETIRFLGKAITVQSIGDAAVIEARNGRAVSFSGEGPDTVLRNFVIANSHIGIYYNYGLPTVTNVTVVGNVYGAQSFSVTRPPAISNSIFWDNLLDDASGCRVTYSCVQRFVAGLGNFSEDPLFADAANGDYHLCSAYGRYSPGQDAWVVDEVSSPCIDAGDPTADFSAEREPNGGRLNIGAHGGTPYAAMSDASPPGDINGDGVFDDADYALFMDLWQQRTPSTTTTRRR